MDDVTGLLCKTDKQGSRAVYADHTEVFELAEGTAETARDHWLVDHYLGGLVQVSAAFGQCSMSFAGPIHVPSHRPCPSGLRAAPAARWLQFAEKKHVLSWPRSVAGFE